MNVFGHSGDCGDLCALLPVIRHLGGGELVLSPHIGDGGPREPMTEARARFLLPVIAPQSYITAARYESERVTPITHDFSHFRVGNKHQRADSLVTWHAQHFKLNAAEIDLSPWLTVTPSPVTRGKVILARSLRYHNPAFLWKRVMAAFRHKTVFIGLPEEHKAFLEAHGFFVPHLPVKDALEMAELIAGSDLFVGNQSFPCWLALAMGHTLIQESFPPVPNSRILRPNAKFVLNNFSIA